MQESRWPQNPSGPDEILYKEAHVQHTWLVPFKMHEEHGLIHHTREPGTSMHQYPRLLTEKSDSGSDWPLQPARLCGSNLITMFVRSFKQWTSQLHTNIIVKLCVWEDWGLIRTAEPPRSNSYAKNSRERQGGQWRWMSASSGFPRDPEEETPDNP